MNVILAELVENDADALAQLIAKETTCKDSKVDSITKGKVGTFNLK